MNQMELMECKKMEYYNFIVNPIKHKERLLNDLPISSNNFKMIMYAADTTLYCNIENREHCADTIHKLF